jgi:tRNA-modifying protein YgfZ
MQSPPIRAFRNRHTGLISVTGRDAETFLHAQLSRRIQGLEPDYAPLAGWHDARGRLRAVFRVLRTDQGFMLLTNADGIDATLRGLRLFVLRADVALEDAGVASTDEHWQVITVIGSGLPAMLAPATRPGNVHRRGDVYAIRLGADLVEVAGPVSAIDDWLKTAGLPAAEVDDASVSRAEIRLALPALPAALSGRFLPQMLNLDRMDAISFDKGCFPGQEVITRTHHLGQVKRRMALFSAATADTPAPGTEVLDDHGAVAGEVVRAARAGEHVELLAVVPVNSDSQLWLPDRIRLHLVNLQNHSPA